MGKLHNNRIFLLLTLAALLLGACNMPDLTTRPTPVPSATPVREEPTEVTVSPTKVMDDELGAMLSNFNPDGYFAGIGSGRQEYVIVSQPSYITAANELFAATDLDTWKEYARISTIYAFWSVVQ